VSSRDQNQTGLEDPTIESTKACLDPRGSLEEILCKHIEQFFCISHSKPLLTVLPLVKKSEETM